uniref:ABC transporter permease n=1 Tax=Cupriavidus taiwanensis TaxID=164546 RepID=UPI000E2FA870|nr:ABC transporter permease [Cupriavidus taiwanensis]
MTEIALTAESNASANAEKRDSLPTRILCNRSVRIGGGVVLAYIMVALFGPLIWTTDPYVQDLMMRLRPPAWTGRGVLQHPLGTDQLGRDVLARLLEGARVSLTIGFCAASIGAVIGITLGSIAGYFGRLVDHAVMFGLTCKLALPSLLLAMTLIYFIQPSLTTVVCVIGLMHWTLYLVVTRSATQRIRELDYVKASKLAGASARQIILWDILPNLAGSLLVVFTAEVAVSILAEASLSFLGVGVPSPIPSWGLMISEGKAVMFLNPWIVLLPGVSLFLLVIGVNLLGDGLRDVIQPQTRD